MNNSSFGVFAQVEEAVAVLQAHQAKKDATQKVGNMANSAATATAWRRCAVFKWYDLFGTYIVDIAFLFFFVNLLILFILLGCGKETRCGEGLQSLTPDYLGTILHK